MQTSRKEIVSNCTALVGYKTYPHIDMYEAGEHAGRIVVRALNGEINPVMAWGNRPILAQTLRMGHEDKPMGPLIDTAREEEQKGLLAASVFGGFPLADFWHAGLSVVTVADGDRSRARTVCERLLDDAWAERREFVFDSKPLEETIASAKTLTEGPIVLLDHADNTASGGTQDTVAVLREVIRQGLGERGDVRYLRPAGGGDHGECRGRQHHHSRAGWQGGYARHRTRRGADDHHRQSPDDKRW